MLHLVVENTFLVSQPLFHFIVFIIYIYYLLYFKPEPLEG